MHTESHSPTRLAVTFDDDRAVAGAGLALVATLSNKLGTYGLANQVIDLGDRPGHALPGRKVLTLVHAMVAGADCIDDCDVLRSGATGKVLGHGVMAPSTLGTFLRSFSFGHVRQLDRLSEELLTRAWGFGAGPGEAPMTIDIDSTICQVSAKTSRAPPTATPRCSGSTPWSPPEPAPARSFTSAIGRARPPAAAERPVSCAKRSAEHVGPGQRVH